MLQLTIHRNSNNNITGYTAKGHCGYAEQGKDIVCAGVSVLLQLPVLVFFHKSLEIIEKYKEYVTIPFPEGIVENKNNQVILKAVLIGLREIEEQYPNCLKIEEIIQ